MTALRDRIDEIVTMKEWLLLDKFDRRKVNRRLRQYAAGDDEWQWHRDHGDAEPRVSART